MAVSVNRQVSDVSTEVDKTADKKPDQEVGKSLVAGYSVLTKTMIGSGLLFIPTALIDLGLVVGILMIIGSALATWWSLHLLTVVGLKSLNEKGSLSFFELAKTLAPKTAYLIDISIVIMCFGCAVVYLMLVGNLVFDVMNDSTDGKFQDYKVLIECLARSLVVISLAYFALAKNLGSTKIANLVGLGCTLFLVIVVVIIGIKDTSGKELDYQEAMAPKGWYFALNSVPVFLFNYHCQCNMFSVIEDTDRSKRTLKNLSMVSAMSVATTAFFSFIMIIPFVAYGLKNVDSILVTMTGDRSSAENNKKNVLLLLSKICVALSVSISYPLQMQPLRKSVIALIRQGKEFVSEVQERNWRLVVAGTAVVLSLAIACSGAKVGVVVNVTGILGCHTVSFVMPLILYIRHLEREKIASSGKILAYKIALGFMIAMYPICLLGLGFYEANKPSQ